MRLHAGGRAPSAHAPSSCRAPPQGESTPHKRKPASAADAGRSTAAASPTDGRNRRDPTHRAVADSRRRRAGGMHAPTSLMACSRLCHEHRRCHRGRAVSQPQASTMWPARDRYTGCGADVLELRSVPPRAGELHNTTDTYICSASRPTHPTPTMCEWDLQRTSPHCPTHAQSSLVDAPSEGILLGDKSLRRASSCSF